MNVFILLAVMLIGGFIFLALPIKLPKNKNLSLQISQFPTKDIRAIVLFVPTLRKDEELEKLLAYKILSQLSNDKTSTKHVWLIHGDLSTEEGASYYNTHQLVKNFKSSKIRIQTYSIENIFDASEVFLMVNKILSSENLEVKTRDIVCDCTSGTKLVTLGIALASMSNGRLVYFPKTETDDAREYIEINTEVFRKSFQLTMDD